MRDVFLILILLLPFVAFSQDTIPSKMPNCIERDLTDVIRAALHKPVKDLED